MNETRERVRVAVHDFQEDGCEPGRGTDVARAIADGLKRSGLFRVMSRSESLGAVGENGLDPSFRFHPGWTVGRMILTGTDIAVIGRVRPGTPDGLLRLMMMTAAGLVLVSGERTSIRSAIELLTSKLLDSDCYRQVRSVSARVQAVCGSCLLISLGREDTLASADQVEIDVLLEGARDPCFADEFRLMAHVAARAGRASIADAGNGFAVLEYGGDVPFRAGQQVELRKL